MEYRLPDGTITSDIRTMGLAWKEIVDPVADILGMDVIGFYPDAIFGPKQNVTGHVAGATLTLPLPILKTILALHTQMKDHEKLLRSIRDTVQKTKSSTYGYVDIESLPGHVADMEAKGRDFFKEYQKECAEADKLRKELADLKGKHANELEDLKGQHGLAVEKLNAEKAVMQSRIRTLTSPEDDE